MSPSYITPVDGVRFDEEHVDGAHGQSGRAPHEEGLGGALVPSGVDHLRQMDLVFVPDSLEDEDMKEMLAAVGRSSQGLIGPGEAGRVTRALYGRQQPPEEKS